MKLVHAKKSRRGIVIVLVAMLLIPLMGMMAFSIDLGYAVEVRAELVNATDAAALAGVQQLYSPYRQWLLATGSTKTHLYNNAITNAKATATAVANANRAGGATVQLVDGDVDVGYTDGSGKYHSGNAGDIPDNAFPNTVIVTARRDNTSLPNSNGEVSLFFGPVFGKGSLPLTASATAVAYEGVITNFNAASGSYGPILPVAVDQNEWTDFYKNGVNSAYQDPNAPSGTAWLNIYPGGTGESMDGLLSLNGSKAASQQYYAGTNGWIQAGAASTDITNLKSSGDLPLPTDGSGQKWASGPGLKDSLLTDFQALIVIENFQALVTDVPSVRYLPLFNPNSDGTTTGGNGTYQITYFVPVIVVFAQGNGQANMDIAVTAGLGDPVTDPSVVVSNVVPMGTSPVPPQFTVPVTGKITQ
jgi:Flp pilus assembly protein TadG